MIIAQLNCQSTKICTICSTRINCILRCVSHSWRSD
jgi:hypothetical protein